MIAVSEERRYKLVYVKPESILALLSRRPGTIYWESYDLPPDVTVVTVTSAWERNAIAFLIEHPSFDKCELGELPPTVNATSLVVAENVPKVDP